MQFGKYRFVERFAIGGMAEVFLAIAQGGEGFEKPVVIKRLLPQLAANPRFLQMFFDEARILLSLQHGCIVQILDMGKMGGLPFLTLEYVDGRDLRTTLSRAQDYRTPLPYGLAAYIAYEVCRALDYAHRKKDVQGNPLHIVHRDVGPSNIFLSFEGGVKIGDFGLAKARDNMEKTETGTIKGKFSYLSPEQAEGKDVDHRSDIFSLGTTIYEMTCGARPFVGDTDLEIVMKVREANYLPPTSVIPGYPLELAAIVARAMQRDPVGRYETAGEMLDDLSRFLQHQAPGIGERHLSEFLNELFAAERRSNSFLIRLPAIDELPPPMTAIVHDGPFSVFQDDNHQGSGTASPTGQIVVPPHVQSLTPGTLELPQVNLAAVPRKKQGTILTILSSVIIAAIVAIIVLYRALNPPMATLHLNTTPNNAKVFLDGRDTNLSTPATIENLRIGQSYTLTFRHSETEEITQSFRPQESKSYASSFVLPYLEEELFIDSTPSGSEILVDSQLRGTAPLTLKLRRGRDYTIVVQKIDYRPKTVHHQASQRKETINLTLEAIPKEKEKKEKDRPKSPSIFAASRPTGILEIHGQVSADIYINGRWAGLTPGFQKRLPVGQYSVTVKPRGKNVKHQAMVPIVEHKIYRLTMTN